MIILNDRDKERIRQILLTIRDNAERGVLYVIEQTQHIRLTPKTAEDLIIVIDAILKFFGG